jgi:hypothetical protein
MEQLQSQICMTNGSSYLVKYLRISLYIRKPFLNPHSHIRLFNQSHLNWISLYMRKINFVFFFSARIHEKIPKHWTHRSGTHRIMASVFFYPNFLTFLIRGQIQRRRTVWSQVLSKFTGTLHGQNIKDSVLFGSTLPRARHNSVLIIGQITYLRFILKEQMDEIVTKKSSVVQYVRHIFPILGCRVFCFSI